MPLQICEFEASGAVRGEAIDVPRGAPKKVSNVTGAYTVDRGTLVRFKGVGTVTWPGIAIPEEFDGIEFRQLEVGQTFTVA